MIRPSDNAPLADEALQKSMHKTYTDAYQLTGFMGGDWAYASNTNDAVGLSCGLPENKIPHEERRLGVYYLGWESTELHEDGTKEEAFLEELRNLDPWMGAGTGAWYALLRKHE
ncbi:hypothetical protein J3459_011341 [Metarhizium acridum]|nr:hypothetical protein J3459_011341 [Metarhizium acridum]